MATQTILPTVELKAIAFVDCCGYSDYTSAFGDLAAVDMHLRLRRAAELEAAATHVEVVKWMGDGAMLASDALRPILTCIYRTMIFARDAGLLPLRAGMTCGHVARVHYGGPDYFGLSVNRAARLCSSAAAWQLRAVAAPGQPTVNYTLRIAGPRLDACYPDTPQRSDTR